MSPNLEQSIQKVSDKVDSHHKSSIEFYTEMRVSYQNIASKLDKLEKSVMKTDLKIDDFERRMEKTEIKQDKHDRLITWTLAWLIFLLFLVFVLLAQ